MVFCTPAAMGAAVGSGATGAATAFGLKLDKEGVELSREAMLLQMRQAKRMFTAQWAEASYHHGEALAQAAQQHAEAQALTTAQYFQAERIHSEGMKLARDQDTRAFEIAWRAEARESLRDELANQFNRYNIIMLCASVLLGCVMPLVESGAPPEGTGQMLLNCYLFSMGTSIMFFIVSLWHCVIVMRRLHEHTAAILERKLFADNEELQKRWQDQIENRLPTGSDVMNLLNQAYQEWLDSNIQPIGNASIQFLSVGVIFLFITAGLLTHARYVIDYDAPVAVSLFWVMVAITAVVVNFVKFREDAQERIKQGCYDKSWLDIPTTKGPMAKIKNVTDELFSSTAVYLGSKDRTEHYKQRELAERNFMAHTEALHAKAGALLTQAEKRAKARKNVLEALTAASEEMDALPEDLIARLNDVIHQVDDLDKMTEEAMNMPSKYSENEATTDMDEDPYVEEQEPLRVIMNANPIDAHRTLVSLTSLRKKLGETPLTTLIRIRNMSEEPLRIKSGVQLRDGKYIKDIDITLLANRNQSLETGVPGSQVTYHLFPIEEIPPRTEVAIVARSAGSSWIPTSGIDGELVFVNTRQTWSFRINFTNSLSRANRTCRVNAIAASSDADRRSGKWIISHETIDHESNHEVLVAIEKRRSAGVNRSIMRPLLASSGQHTETPAPALNTVQEDTGVLNSNIPWMTGSLSLQVVGLQVLWQKKWCTLTTRAMSFSARRKGKVELEILLKDVTKVQAIPNGAHKYVFDVYSTQRKPVRLAGASMAERDHWIQRISDAKGRDVADWGGHQPIPMPAEEPRNPTVDHGRAGTGTGTNGSYRDSEAEAGGTSTLELTPSTIGSREGGRPQLSIESLPV